MPVCADLLGPGWLETNGLVPLPAQPPMIEQLWLLLPKGAVNSRAARSSLRLLRQKVAKTKTMQELHGAQP